jgi:hypothetical protein
MMGWRVVAFVLAALGGIVLFAVGGAWRIWPLQIAGLALEIACLAAGWRWFARLQKPPPIKPAENPAWSMREQPPPDERNDPPST